MGLIYFIVGSMFGFVIHSILSISSVNDAYDRGFKDGKEQK